MIKTLQEVDEQHLQGFLIANNNYYSDYTEIFLKEYLQLLYHGLLFLLPVATTEAGHCWEYLVYVGSCCAYRSITKSILHELGGFVCFFTFSIFAYYSIGLTSVQLFSGKNARKMLLQSDFLETITL